MSTDLAKSVEPGRGRPHGVAEAPIYDRRLDKASGLHGVSGTPTASVSARVRASINGVSADTVVSFVTALPHSIFVSPADAVVGPNADNRISVSLLRDIGVASGGQIVGYAAKDAGGVVVHGQRQRHGVVCDV